MSCRMNLSSVCAASIMTRREAIDRVANVEARLFEPPGEQLTMLRRGHDQQRFTAIASRPSGNRDTVSASDFEESKSCR